MPSPAGSRSRNWVFTLNNPDGLLEFSDKCDVRYAIYQGEIGESGTYHFQGYVQFSQPTTMSRVRSAIGGAPHLEIRAGSHQEAVRYVSKEDTRVDGPYEYGQPVDDQGARNDLATFYKLVRGGKDDLQLADNNFGLFSRYLRGIDRVRLCASEPRKEKTRVILVIGPSGSGKTSWVHKFKVGGLYTKGKDIWWNGYGGNSVHPNVLFDDMGDWFPYQSLLDVCDRYPTVVPQKLGSPVVFNSGTIYITSVRTPRLWYPSQHSLIEFYRRVDIVYCIDDSYDVVKRSIGDLEGDPSIDAALQTATSCPPWAEANGSQDSPIEIE